MLLIETQRLYEINTSGWIVDSDDQKILAPSGAVLGVVFNSVNKSIDNIGQDHDATIWALRNMVGMERSIIRFVATPRAIDKLNQWIVTGKTNLNFFPGLIEVIDIDNL